MLNSILCGKQVNDGFKVYLYDKGEKTEILLSSSDKSELPGILNELFLNINSVMRLHVDPDRAESIKKEDKAVEIIFNDEVSFKTKDRGEYKLIHLMIPLSGDLSLDQNEKRVIFLKGNPEYSGSPLVSNCDEVPLEKLFKMIDN